MFSRAALVLAGLAARTLAATYGQADSFEGAGFYDGFTFMAISDPTEGRVRTLIPTYPYRNYVDRATAVSQNLTYGSGDTFILRADSTTTLAASDPGRNSVRLQSNKLYNTHVTMCASVGAAVSPPRATLTRRSALTAGTSGTCRRDAGERASSRDALVWLIRMSCPRSTWPALWEFGPDWPNDGEVDILEGVNDHGPNQATLHTSANCAMPATRDMTGTSTGNNCDVNETGNSGCGVQSDSSSSYGPAFNAIGGGFYAMERTNSFIKVWFWPRNSGSIPSDVLSGATSVTTDSWGTPFAYFPSQSCDLSTHFSGNNIIINLTLCGVWAGVVFNADGCPGDCVTYVNQNPGAFANAYFDVAWLKVYQ
ncbi:endo-beta-glucanase [Epithele typhae]|uniref:endo-beta-glucanase n=1 Tax=Epithele typhae TaxID=378194 RepID=UPI0020081C23|nr:endo-beta-glucanase [Epithele typhae]KAH9938887.1 endo-beta-glucanase [Epithele typhae]